MCQCHHSWHTSAHDQDTGLHTFLTHRSTDCCQKQAVWAVRLDLNITGNVSTVSDQNALYNIIIIIMSVFLQRLSTRNMLNCAEQVQIQKDKAHAYKTLKTVDVQIIMLKHLTKNEKKEYPKNPYTVSTYTKITLTIQTNDDRHTHTQHA